MRSDLGRPETFREMPPPYPSLVVHDDRASIFNSTLPIVFTSTCTPPPLSYAQHDVKEEEERVREESESISPYNTPPYPSQHVQFVQLIPSIDALPVKEEREIILPFPSCNVMFSKEEPEKEKRSVVEEEEGMEMSDED